MGREGPPGQLYLPPGFRFYPTDEELVVDYLCKKTAAQPFTVPIIADVDLYRFDPWDLPEKALFGEKEWYFFSPRDRKYPNGSRPNRAAGTGYWKATGTDKPIYTMTNGHKQLAGVKKALVFYIGKAPKGNKTNWIMHEYRLADAGARAAKRKGSIRLDDWVLCRIYKKTMGAQKAAAAAAAAAAAKENNESASCLDEVLASLPDIDDERLMSLPRLNSLNFLMDNSNKPGDVEVKDSGDNVRRSQATQPNYSWLNSTNPNINNNNISVPTMVDLGHKDQQYSNITEVEYNNNNNQQRNGVYDNLAAMLSRRPPRPSLIYDSPDEEVQSSFRLRHNENLLHPSSQPLGFGIDPQVPTSLNLPPQDPQLYPLNLAYDNAFLASLGSNFLQKPR